MRVKLEDSTSAIELYMEIENSARKSLLEWAKIAKDTPESNIIHNNSEHHLPKLKYIEFLPT